MKPLLKTLTWIAIVILLAICCSCSSEPVKWGNHYLRTAPGSDSLQVRQGKADFHWEKQGENFIYKIETQGDSAKVTITNIHGRIDFAWFDGFVRKGSDEIHWNYSADKRTIWYTGRFLEGYDFYEASISKDKQK